MDTRDLKIVLKLQDEASAELRAFGVGITDVEKKTQNLGLRIGDTEISFRKMAAVGTAAFAAIGYGALSAVRSFESFNFEIERAGAFINASESELESFRQAAVDAARGTQFSFEQTAVALGNFVGGEIDAATAAKELGGVIDLALVAKLQDLQQAVNIGSLALTVFKKDGMEMSDVTDIMATVAADVTTQTEQWATALVNSAGAAKASGLSFKDLNVIFAQMVRGGADVNLIWSAFNSAINSIQAPSKQATDAIESVGLTTEGLASALRDGPIPLLDYLRQGFEKANETGQGFAFLADVLGRQAAPEFALALGLTNEELAETAGYFEGITGRGAAMTEQLREAMPATQMLGQAMAELNLIVGKALEPAVRQLSETLKPIIAQVTQWIEQNPELTRLIVIATLAISGLVAVAGILGLLLPTITAGFTILMGPVGLVIAILGVLSITVWKVVQIMDLLLNHSGEVWAGLKIMFKEAVDWIIAHTLTPLMGWIDRVRAALSALAAAASSVVSSVGSKVGGMVSGAVNALIPGRASGGPVSAGSPYIVGEQGPELFVPGRSGSIIPNGAGINVNVTINGDVSGEELIARVQEGIMQGLRLNTKFAI